MIWLAFPNDHFTAYETGKIAPDTSYLSAIAAAGADVNYIITGVRAGAPSVPTLSREEECLLDNYRHSDEAGKAAVLRNNVYIRASESGEKDFRRRRDSLGLGWKANVKRGYHGKDFIQSRNY